MRYYLKISTDYLKDTIECKLFGIGSESYVVGSHEFYLGYAVKNNMMLTLDAGHFHPTEGIADKISSILLFVPEINLHVSRPERWDSDHVVILNDALLELSQELVRSGQMDKLHVGLDYFDGSINRIGAYVVGIRATQKALFKPYWTTENFIIERKQEFSANGLPGRIKGLTRNAVYNYYCCNKAFRWR